MRGRHVLLCFFVMFCMITSTVSTFIRSLELDLACVAVKQEASVGTEGTIKERKGKQVLRQPRVGSPLRRSDSLILEHGLEIWPDPSNEQWPACVMSHAARLGSGQWARVLLVRCLFTVTSCAFPCLSLLYSKKKDLVRLCSRSWTREIRPQPSAPCLSVCL
jgi:hypothetical protein